MKVVIPLTFMVSSGCPHWLRVSGGLFFGGEEYAAGLIVDVDGVGAEEIHA